MKPILLNILALFISVVVYSQSYSAYETVDDSTNTSISNKIKIFLDCNDCNSNVFRLNLTFADFVRDPKIADIHVFVTEQKTGSNSTEYGINFIGMNQYSDIEYKLKTIATQNDTYILKWERLLKIIDIDLLPCISRISDISGIKIKHETNIVLQFVKEINPWNYWVFRIDLDTEFQGEKSNKEYPLNVAVKADRINDNHKFRMDTPC